MSYCRFSSDDWKSDVYVYESQEGYVIHVAGNRLVGAIPALPEEVNTEAFWVRYKEQMDFVTQAARVNIGGAFDGADFTLSTLEELRDKLRELVAAGYHVPAHVFTAIEEEMKEEQTA